MWYNVRKKTFPNGTIQYVWHSQYADEGYTAEAKKKKPRTEVDIERSRRVSRSRTVQAAYDILAANCWALFVTLTFAQQIYDYEQLVAEIQPFFRLLRENEIGYFFVLERHKKGGFHLHGVLTSAAGLTLEPARSPHTGKLLLDNNGRQIYNILDYQDGFSTATFVDDTTKASGYLCKYLTKEMDVPKGKKRYWSSRGLNRPVVEYLDMDNEEFFAMVEPDDYKKVTEWLDQKFLFVEKKGEAK